MEYLFSTIGVSIGILFLLTLFLLSRYKRCPSNKVLVIYGNVGKGRSARCVHGGGAFILPVIQDWQFLNLNPIPIEIDLRGALSKQNIRINTPSTFTVAISTKPEIMLNAAERLLSLDESEIKTQALDIIIGQLRLVIATLTIEEINQDREQFLSLINKHVATELNKIGLELINVNIKDITDESGYLEAIGKKAAAEAINVARVEVAQQERSGAIGETKALREKEVEVASELAAADEGRKEADSKKRIAIAELEAQAIEGENISKARVVEYNATLAEKSAEARRRSEVAEATAKREILENQKATEQARLEKDEIIHKEVQKRKQEIDAEAEAERVRRIAKGEADAALLKYNAEAEGLQKLLEAKANGYKEILNACEGDTNAAAILLLIEKLESLVAKQTEAIANLKIDKITVWEGGGEQNGNATTNFVRNFINTLPPMHELAQQVGIELPQFLGNINPQDLQKALEVSTKANGRKRKQTESSEKAETIEE
ncbi:flotillin family protein [Eisenibacter elegans]|uniref:flotillin family protein n=1 Tax=Eisenibacter elegans TaxID=997 RepID=UPI0012B63831|nr:flotillin family protein [Eisenibacter elegans]